MVQEALLMLLKTRLYDCVFFLPFSCVIINPYLDLKCQKYLKQLRTEQTKNL